MDIKVTTKYVLEVDGKIVSVSSDKKALEIMYPNSEENIREISWVETLDLTIQDVQPVHVPSKQPTVEKPDWEPYKTPTWPDIYPTYPAYPTYPTGKSTCPKCGLVLETVMGYCCPRLDCPTGMGPTICSTSDTQTSTNQFVESFKDGFSLTLPIISETTSAGCGNNCAGCACKGNKTE